MFDLLDVIIVLILAQFAVYLCYVISVQLEKVLPKNSKPYVYLLVGLVALCQVLKLISKFGLTFYKISVSYFWIIFLIGMLALFVKEKKKINRQYHSGKNYYKK